MQVIITNIKKYVVIYFLLSLFCAAPTTVKQAKISPSKAYVARIQSVDPGAIGSSTEIIQIENISTKKKKNIFGIEATDQIKMQWEGDTLNIYKVGEAQCRLISDRFEVINIKLHILDHYSDFFKSLP